jgi:hypothetical protein
MDKGAGAPGPRATRLHPGGSAMLRPNGKEGKPVLPASASQVPLPSSNNPDGRIPWAGFSKATTAPVVFVFLLSKIVVQCFLWYNFSIEKGFPWKTRNIVSLF